jgi:hypothetical protein
MDKAYRLKLIDRGGNVAWTEWLNSPSDQAAYEVASTVAGSKLGFELWHQKRFVSRTAEPAVLSASAVSI